MWPLSAILRSHQFVLWIAPPASGKTSGLLELFAREPMQLIYISPLRALAQEFFQRAAESTRDVFYDDDPAAVNFERRFLYVTSAEKLSTRFLRKACSSSYKTIVVIDEVHLFFGWGESFRPRLWECLLDVGVSGLPCLGLTATWSETYHQEWQRDFLLSYEDLYVCDFGNLRFRFPPKNIWVYGNWAQGWLKSHVLELMGTQSRRTTLIFCRYRNEVKRWQQAFKRAGIQVLGCVGGETQKFIEQLKICQRPQVIVSTSALGHGVNLPPIGKVFLTYPEARADLWLQMAARGGRDGGEFELHVLNIPGELGIAPFFPYAKTLARVIFLAVKCYLFGNRRLYADQG